MPEPIFSTCDFVVAFALAEEAGGLVDRLEGVNSVKAAGFVVRRGTLAAAAESEAGADVAVVETGVGAAAASKVISAVLATHKPRWLISAGFAGALVDGIARGDLLLPTCVVAKQQPEITLETPAELTELSPETKLHTGRLLSVDAIVRLRDDKLQLSRTFDAVAVDMETYAVAYACAERATPLVSVRIISDNLDQELSADIAHIGEQASKVGRVGAALGSLLRRPASIKEMLRLREQALIASDTLADYLVAAIRRLHAHSAAEKGNTLQ